MQLYNELGPQEVGEHEAHLCNAMRFFWEKKKFDEVSYCFVCEVIQQSALLG